MGCTEAMRKAGASPAGSGSVAAVSRCAESGQVPDADGLGAVQVLMDAVAVRAVAMRGVALGAVAGRSASSRARVKDATTAPTAVDNRVAAEIRITAPSGHLPGVAGRSGNNRPAFTGQIKKRDALRIGS
jgi:hypothetical protein